MTAVIVAVIFLIGGALGRALLTDEIRGWANRFPGWLLCQAAKHLDPDDQAIYEELWLPDLKFILHEDRPITRLVKATRMAAGLLVETRREARAYRRPEAPQPFPPSNLEILAATNMLTHGVDIDHIKPDFIINYGNNIVIGQVKKFRGQ